MSTTSTVNTSAGARTLGTTSSTVLSKDNVVNKIQKNSLLESVAEESGPQVEEADEKLLEADRQTMKAIRHKHNIAETVDIGDTVASPTSPQNILMLSKGYIPSNLS